VTWSDTLGVSVTERLACAVPTASITVVSYSKLSFSTITSLGRSPPRHCAVASDEKRTNANTKNQLVLSLDEKKVVVVMLLPDCSATAYKYGVITLKYYNYNCMLIKMITFFA
jgi:hypothetical protein